MVQPLIPPVVPKSRRLDRRAVGLLSVGALLIAGALFVAVVRPQRHLQAEGLTQQRRPIAEDGATGTLPMNGMERQRQESYEKLSLVPAKRPMVESETPFGQPGIQRVSGTALGSPDRGMAPLSPTPPMGNILGTLPKDTLPFPGPNTGTPATAGAIGKTVDKTPASGVRPPQLREERQTAASWGFAKMQQPDNDGWKTKKDVEEAGTKEQTGDLFPKAVWEIPADPTKVLYANQVINGQLMHSINSDQPGIIRVLVTERVEDQFFQGVELIPQYSVIIAKQEGKTVYGTNTIRATVSKAIFRNGKYTGATVKFDAAQVGDQTGSAGIPGDVDNHWPAIIGGSVASALLTIGVRAPFGSTQNYNQNLSQEAAENVATSLNRSAQNVISRAIPQGPTIRAKEGDPVTIQMENNISFQTEPAIVRK